MLFSIAVIAEHAFALFAAAYGSLALAFGLCNVKIPMRLNDGRLLLFFCGLGLLICLLPCWPLLDLRATFDPDWFNHLWLIDYYAQYFRSHHSFPAVINTNQCVGIPLTLFYADRFYTGAGIIASLVGSAWAIRIFVFLALLAQCGALIRAFRPRRVGAGLSIAICVSVTFGIYPLTNLYNRSAIPEFFAGVFFTIALCLLFSALVSARLGESYSLAYAGSFLFFCITALTHPLTGWFGAVFYGLFWVLTAISTRSWRFCIEGVFGFLLTAVALSPWIYMVLVFGRALPVNDSQANKTFFQKTFFFDQSIDAWWSRLSPVALDFRSLRAGLKVATPYLDAQANVSLMILIGIALFHACKHRKIGAAGSGTSTVLIVGGAVTTLVYLVVSLNPPISRFVGGYFDVLQFPYRLTAFVNYGLLLTAFGVALKAYGTGLFEARSCRGLVAVVVSVSTLGLFTKLLHSEVISGMYAEEGLRVATEPDHPPAPESYSNRWMPLPVGYAPHITNLPRTFYGTFLYAVKTEYDPHPPPNDPQNSCVLKVDEGPRFGGVRPLATDISQSAWLATNVLPFPWNRLTLDGRSIPSKAIRVGRMDGFADWMRPCNQVISVPAGAHTIGYQFRPTRAWRNLRSLSNVVLVAWSGLAAGCGLWRLFTSGAKSMPISPISSDAASGEFRPQGQADAKVGGD
jgi:hypothetical protein